VKVFQVFAKAMQELELDPVFGLMGDANMLYVADFKERGGRFVPSVHEAGAVAMADGWSRMTGRIGVATVTHGPGLSNTATALIEAVRSRSRVLLLTGDTPPEPTHFQRIDIAAFASMAGAGYERVYGPDSVVRDLNRALARVAGEGRPVVLDLPAALLGQQCGAQVAVSPPRWPEPAAASAEQLDAALGLIASAERPVIVAGRGAVEAGARDAIVALAERIAAPLATTVLAKDLFRGHPDDLGLCGSLSHDVASGALGKADVLIVFGAALNVYTSFHGELTRGKRIVQVDRDPGRFGWYVPVDEPVCADARSAAEAMVAALDDADHAPSRTWLEGIRAALAERDPVAEFRDRTGPDTVDIRTACLRLDDQLPGARTVVSDIGRFTSAAWRYLGAPSAEDFTTMGGFGSIGLGLAGAIGAAVARPDTTTVAVLGDGGFMMNAAELSTAVRERLAMVVVVFNDGAYGAEYHKLLGAGADPNHSLNRWPELAPIAEAMGAEAVVVRKLDELESLRLRVAEATGPLVVELKLDPAVNPLA
jgi:thiamine pyrophosphate-dependent acetolactate synthase large subunit-like protein